MGISLAEINVGSVLSGIGTLAKDIRSAITGEISPEKKAELEGKLLELEQVGMSAQNAVNLEEAKSDSFWKSGWRPGVGWICVAGLAMHFIVNPLIVWGAQLYGKTVTPPVFDAGTLMSLVIPLLGLGAYRTYEKVKK